MSKINENNLFINKHPNLVKEWNVEMNKDIDIKTISFSSHKKVYWSCEKGHMYLASLNNRTKKKKGGGSKCSVCAYDLLRVHDKDVLNTLRMTYNPRINTTSIGDENENFITNLLLDTNKYKNVKTIGNLGTKSDVAITHIDNSINYIQIKTLTKNRKNSYYLTNNSKYPDNMLIVMLNKEKTCFALEFSGNIKVKRLSLSYDYKKSKYQNIMFTNIEKFTSKLIELIPQSCNTDNSSTLSIDKEQISLLRLKKICDNNNLKYEKNKTNGDTIDCFINNFKIQAKFVSTNCKNTATYNVTSNKSCGRLKGKQIKRNYEENDFDMIIVEVGGIKDNENKYINNFCFIPKDILIEQNILKTTTCKGKKSFSVCQPDYEREHWSKKYWNNISVFEIKK